MNTSQIQLTIPENSKSVTDLPLNVQICIGKNIVFCAQRDLSSLSQSDISFIIQFILYKLIKYWLIFRTMDNYSYKMATFLPQLQEIIDEAEKHLGKNL